MRTAPRNGFQTKLSQQPGATRFDERVLNAASLQRLRTAGFERHSAMKNLSPYFFNPQIILIVLAIGASIPSPLSAQDDASTTNAAHQAFETARISLKQFNEKHSRVFQGGCVPIHYLEWTSSGTPLVLLHGTYSTAHDFVRFAPQLLKAGYRPISVDWYGHGQTPIPGKPVSAHDFSRDLKALLHSLDISKAIIAGHSRGGALASAFYEASPDRVLGLILIDGGSTHTAQYFASLGSDGLNDWMGAAFDAKTGKPLAPTYATQEQLFSAAWERFGKPKAPVEMFDILSQSGQNDEGRWTQMRQSLRRWLKQDTRDNTFSGMLRPKDAPPFFASTVLLDPLKSLKRLDVPVLILDATGSHENYRDTTPTEHNERLQKLHPDWIEHTQVPTGHFVHREAPDLFITAMEKFHQRLGQSRR